MKLVDILLILVIAAILVAVIIRMIQNHKKGNDCSCGCEHCKHNCTRNKNIR